MAVKTAQVAGVENQFAAFVQQWKAECAFLSSTSAMLSHPAYQAIIALGLPVVPLLLHELEKEPVHWFEALKAITSEDPVSPEDWGNIPAMAAAWLAWGRFRNLL